MCRTLSIEVEQMEEGSSGWIRREQFDAVDV